MANFEFVMGDDDPKLQVTFTLNDVAIDITTWTMTAQVDVGGDGDDIVEVAGAVSDGANGIATFDFSGATFTSVNAGLYKARVRRSVSSRWMTLWGFHVKFKDAWST